MLDEKILSILRTNRESYISSDELCKVADISRAAIWKRVEKLREEGYEIEALPHLGYRLVSVPDSLIPMEIRWKLRSKIIGREVISYKKLDSTNDAAYELAKKGMKEGTVVLAEEQAKGRGRHGRSWESPSRGGIYLSCILRPSMAPQEIPKITLVAAVSVAKAIRKVAGLPVTIKWPNDIMIDGRKICGILTEMKAEQDAIEFLVVGIGINVNAPVRQLPKGAASIREELRGRGGHDHRVSRIDLVRAVLEELESDYLALQEAGAGPIIEEWKALSLMIGSRVKVTLPNRVFEGVVHDLDLDGALVVRREGGILERISSGDIVMVR